MFNLNSFSQGECYSRNNCKWGCWKHKATANVFVFGVQFIDNDVDCIDHAVSDHPSNTTDGIAYESKYKSCAYQVAKNKVYSYYFNGAVSRRICARGGAYSDLFYDSQSNEKENDDFESSSINTTATIFEENKVIIESSNGYLTAKGENMFSSFELKFWLPQSHEDSIISIEKTFYTAKIEVINGKLILSYNLPKESFELVKKDNGELLVNINNLRIEAILPEGINGKTNIIEVVGTSDGGVKEKQVIDDIIKKSDEVIDFSINPNPTTDGNLTITFKQAELLKNTSIKLYNNSGKFIKNIKINGEYSKNSVEKFNLYDFTQTKGIYFIMIQSASSTLIKKVILM